MKNDGIVNFSLGSFSRHRLVPEKGRTSGIVEIGSGALGKKPGQQAFSRGPALGRITVRIAKQHAASGQLVEVGSQRLGVSIHDADPVV